MVLDYKEMENIITSEIMKKKQHLKTLCTTIDEANEYGYNVVFGMENEADAIKSGFESGRAIGVVEGEIDQLQRFLSMLYDEEYNKNK